MAESAGSVFASASNNARSWQQNAGQLMQAIQAMATNAASQTVQLPAFGEVDLSTDYIQALQDFLQAETPAPVQVELRPPALPAEPVIAVPGLANIAVPEFSAAEPSLQWPAPPQLPQAEAPGAVPDFQAPALPTPPVLTLPPAPSLQALALPEPPQLEFPVWDRSAPDLQLAPPSAELLWAEQPYRSALLDAAQARLLADLQQPDHGLDPDEEQRLWQRERERAEQEAVRQREEVTRSFAARGFPLPTGMQLAAVAAVNRQLAEACQASSRDIALKRAELLQQHRQFTLQQVQQLEQVLVAAHGAAMERMLNAAKYMAEFAIQRFGAEVQQAQLRLEAWRTEAQVFADRIRALVEQANVYQAQLQAAELAGRLQMQKVEVYRALLGAIESQVGIYRSQVEAVQVTAGIEQLKLDAYKSRVEAYVAAVNGQQAQLALHRAQVDGELAKIQLFEAQARAYQTRVDGLRARADLMHANVNATIEVGKLKLAGYQSGLTSYEAGLKAETTRIDQVLRAAGYELERFRTRGEVVSKVVEATSQARERAVRAGEAVNQSALHAAQVEIEQLRNSNGLQLEAARAGAEIYAQLIASSLSTVNAVATVAG